MIRIRRKELASKLAVAPTTVSSWKTRYPDFPQPVGRYYDLDAVLNWKAKHDAEQSDSGKSIPESSP